MESHDLTQRSIDIYLNDLPIVTLPLESFFYSTDYMLEIKDDLPLQIIES